MKEKRLYDEERELPHPWEWVIIILFSASIVGFGLLAYRLVPEGPRYWDLGQLPDTPAESIYSTEVPHGNKNVSPQFQKWPESQPKNPLKPRNVPLRERGHQ
ncbi:MAG TPA: hypothetical protein VGJ93_01965 [Desulfuromonadaceae bacterium]